MDLFSSSLYGGLLIFGKYPTNEEVVLLKKSGYFTFIDLCPATEITWVPYNKDDIVWINYPIYDRGAPKKDVESLSLVFYLVEKIKNNEKIYIHCRGGHGRSATLAAIILIELTSCTGEEAMNEVKMAHLLRKEMKPKFRRIGAPQTRIQKEFVRKWKIMTGVDSQLKPYGTWRRSLALRAPGNR